MLYAMIINVTGQKFLKNKIQILTTLNLSLFTLHTFYKRISVKNKYVN